MIVQDKSLYNDYNKFITHLLNVSWINPTLFHLYRHLKQVIITLTPDWI